MSAVETNEKSLISTVVDSDLEMRSTNGKLHEKSEKGSGHKRRSHKHSSIDKREINDEENKDYRTPRNTRSNSKKPQGT